MTAALFLADVAAHNAAASAALRIALSVFAVFLPPSPGSKATSVLDTLFFLSSSSFYPFRFLADPAVIDRSRGGPIKAHLPSCSADFREFEGDSREVGGRGRRRSEVKFSNAFPQRETRGEGGEKWIERGRGRRRAVQRRCSRFIAFREQHRQNLISSNESLISRKLGIRTDRRTDKQTDGRRSETIPPFLPPPSAPCL